MPSFNIDNAQPSVKEVRMPETGHAPMLLGASNISEEPPLSIIAILNLAWSLILNLSVHDKDVEVGKKVLREWSELHSRKPGSIKDSKYLDHIFCLLFGFVESIAFERYFYYEYIQTQEKIRKQTIDYWNDLADMASFSKDGIILRIASFLGIGGGGFLGIRNLLHINSPNYNTPYIGIFLLSGFGGLVATVVLFKHLRTGKVNSIISSTLDQEQNYWYKVRDNYKENLNEMCKNVMRIQDLYYRGAKKYDDNEIKDIIEKILPQRELYFLDTIQKPIKKR